MNIPEESDYKEVNKKLWDLRLDEHLASDFYDLEGFLSGKSSLNDIELDLLGDISGKSILHLQCHFGQDTISLSRLGAKAVGIDFSERSIQKAKYLAQKTNAEAEFICCNVYDLPEHLHQEFDLVFTSYGTIIWLPDLRKWANIVQRFLKPGGHFVFADFHPVVWMFDDELKEIKYHYHNVNPIVELEEGTYANPEADIQHHCITWNHGIGEVVNSLISEGLSIESLKEYDYAPYPFIKPCKEFESNKYRIEHLGSKIPLVYSIKASKGLSN